MTSAPLAVDLAAIAQNYRNYRAAVPVTVIPVVKADAYGHGAIDIARSLAALDPAQRPPMLAVADAAEAAALRGVGVELPLICWLHAPDVDWQAIREIPDLHLGASSLHELALIADAAPQTAGRVDRDRAASVHLKLDTGLGRNGVRECEWRVLMAQAMRLERAGRVRIAGIMSHVSGTSADDDLAQLAAFSRGVTLALDAGLRPYYVHIAATTSGVVYEQFTSLNDQWVRHDEGGEYRPNLAVRLGLALYGLDPLHPDRLGIDLTPALTLRAEVEGFEDYWVMELGQVDGLPTRAPGLELIDDNGNHWQLGRIGSTHTTLQPVSGGPLREITCIGKGSASADDWADAAGTINYEITTRLMARLRSRDFEAPLSATPDALKTLAPRRELCIDLDLMAARLLGGTSALRAGEPARPVSDRHLSRWLDISADAYGFGAQRIAALGREFGKELVARTRHDVAWLAARGIEARYEPTAGRDTRIAYGFQGRIAASLRSELVQVKRVAAGQAVSYGYTWRAGRATTLGLVPLGYSDAIPRCVGGHAKLLVGGVQVPIVGRVAMDQVVVDLGDANCVPGMPVVCWGGTDGISIDRWCSWSGQSPAAVTATLGARVLRRYQRVDGGQDA